MSSYETDQRPDTDSDDTADAVEALEETAEVARDEELDLLDDAAEKVSAAETLDNLAHGEAAYAVELDAEADQEEAVADEAHALAEVAAADGDAATAEEALELESTLRADAAERRDEADELASLAVETEAVAIELAAEAVEDVVAAEVDEEIAEAAEAVEAEILADETATTADVASTDDVIDEDALLQPVADERPPDSPWNRPGRWFVVHTQSGYEKKVKQNLEARISSMNMEERIYEVVIPMEDVVEFKGGKKVVVQKKMFPGYLLVRCAMDDDSWYVIRNTPGVTGFVGQGAKPSPLPRRDVESFLQVKASDDEGADATRRGRARHEYEMGETVRIKEGPFADFSGQITEINEDQLKVKVEVDIFGRPTPVELEFAQIAKL
jgi:transcription termination/antitermination protein NusG